MPKCLTVTRHTVRIDPERQIDLFVPLKPSPTRVSEVFLSYASVRPRCLWSGPADNASSPPGRGLRPRGERYRTIAPCGLATGRFRRGVCITPRSSHPRIAKSLQRRRVDESIESIEAPGKMGQSDEESDGRSPRCVWPHVTARAALLSLPGRFSVFDRSLVLVPGVRRITARRGFFSDVSCTSGGREVTCHPPTSIRAEEK